jgi:hypothetical protein
MQWRRTIALRRIDVGTRAHGCQRRITIAALDQARQVRIRCKRNHGQ